MIRGNRSVAIFVTIFVHSIFASVTNYLQTEEKLWELEHGMKDHRVFLRELQTNNIVQRFDIGVEYELAQMATNPEISKYRTRV